jgi:hypothetical protein
VDERWLFVAVVWGLHEVVFFATWGLFGALFRAGAGLKYQVAQGKAPPDDLSKKAVKDVLQGHVLLLPFTAFVLYPAWLFFGGHRGDPLPSLFEIAWTRSSTGVTARCMCRGCSRRSTSSTTRFGTCAVTHPSTRTRSRCSRT